MHSNWFLRIAAIACAWLLAACNPSHDRDRDRDHFTPLDPRESEAFKHDDSPSTPTSIGAPCSECTGKGHECFTEAAGFRDGYCTQSCERPNDCPGGSICLDWAPYLGNPFGCYRTCGPLQPCRAGYECVDINAQQICVPGFVPPLPPLPRDRVECASAMGAAGPVTTATPTTLSEPNGYANAPSITVPTKDRVIVAWSHYADYRHQGILTFWSADGGKTFPSSWNSWTLYSADPDYVTTPELIHPSLQSVQLTSSADVASLWVTQLDKLLLPPIDTRYTRWESSSEPEWTGVGMPLSDSPFTFSAGGDLRAVVFAPNPISGATWLVGAEGAPGQAIVLASKTPVGDALLRSSIVLAQKPVDAVRVDRPVIAFHENGGAAVAWVVVRGDALGNSANQIWVQRVDAMGAPIGAATLVSSGDAPVRDRPSIAYRGDRLIVAYTSGTPNGEWQIRAAIAADGVGFGPSVRVDPSADCSLAIHPQLSFAESAAATGEIAVTYYRAIGKLGAVFRTTLASDGTPTTTRLSDWFDLRLAPGGSEIAEHLDVVIAGGKRYTTWTQPDATTTHATARLLIEAVTP